MCVFGRAGLALALILSVGACTAPGPLRPMAAQDGAEQAPDGFATVLAELAGEPGRIWRGSAVAIDACHALTDGHVVQYGATTGHFVTLRRADGARATATIESVSRQMDLAILTFPSGFLSPVQTRLSPVRWMERLEATGTVGGRADTVSGRVTVAAADLRPYGPGFYTSLPVRPGFSGGPVWDADGQWVGVTAAGQDGVGYVLSVAHLLNEARKLIRGNLPPEVSAPPCQPCLQAMADTAVEMP